jgi:acyl carrier protein
LVAVNEKVLNCIYVALDEANEDLLDTLPLEKSLDTRLQAEAGGLDSLALINFLIAVEEGIEQDLGTTILLSDERALLAEPSPLESVRTLAAYIETRLREQQH